MTKRTFIEEARRSQIVTATIDTLAEIGYVKASLAQIAKRAGISTSLISYHFKDKDDLMEQTVNDISLAWMGDVEAKLEEGESSREKLGIYIESNVAYMGTRPKHVMALLEIVFNMRNTAGALRYVVEEDDPSLISLEAIFSEGQQQGEFRAFNTHHMAIAVRGAIDNYLSQMTRPQRELEAFTADLIETFDRATRMDTTDRT